VLALGLAALGAVLPIMPTTVFVLLAAWAFARSSPRLHQAMLAHRRFGPVLRDWELYGAVPRAGKIAAITGMAVSWAIVLVATRHWAAPTLTGLAMLGAGAYVLSRPRPPAERENASPLPSKET